MNIFYVDHDPRVAAQCLVDSHVVKMILETCQLLSTCHHVYNSTVPGMLKLSYRNHPSNVWLRESTAHYEWLHSHLVALCDEYNYRYNKHHTYSLGLVDALRNPPSDMSTYAFTEPPQCMPDDYKVPHNAILGYRQYYTVGKAKLHRWTRRPRPSWIKPQVFNPEKTL